MSYCTACPGKQLLSCELLAIPAAAGVIRNVRKISTSTQGRQGPALYEHYMTAPWKSLSSNCKTTLFLVMFKLTPPHPIPHSWLILYRWSLCLGGKANSKNSEKCDLLYFFLSNESCVFCSLLIPSPSCTVFLLDVSFPFQLCFLSLYSTFLHTVCLKMRKTNSGSTYRVSCQRNPGCALKREM